MNIEKIKELKKSMVAHYRSYQSGKMEMAELEEFVKVLVEFCKETRHPNCVLKTPEVKVAITSSNELAQYKVKQNQLIISKEYLKEILRKKFLFFHLINAIGHEMEHYEQNSIVQEYDNMSAEEQQGVDEKLKKIISSQKKLF